MALRQVTAERGGSRGATAGTAWAGYGPTVEVRTQAAVLAVQSGWV